MHQRHLNFFVEGSKGRLILLALQLLLWLPIAAAFTPLSPASSRRLARRFSLLTTLFSRSKNDSLSATTTSLNTTSKESGVTSHGDSHGKENDSLSHTISSPERYADALGLTTEQVQATKRLRQQHVDALQSKLNQQQQPTSTKTTEEELARQRHRLVCQHRFDHGKHPFVCRQCWSYNPICICNQQRDPKKDISPCREVILWTHQSEWGSPSNTGSVLPLVLNRTRMLMKGLHDDEFEAILKDPAVQPVILWPDMKNDAKQKQPVEGETTTTKRHNFVSAKALRLHSMGDKRIVLIAIEGTWRQARRMVSKLSPEYPRLSIQRRRPSPQDTASAALSPSILAPLRSKSAQASKESVCTAEAVVWALEELGMEPDPTVLDLVRHKIDQTRRYQGKRDKSRVN